mgnify:FL=1
MLLLVLVVWYLICGLAMCWQIKAPYWLAPAAPVLAIGGMFAFVSRDLWLRATDRREQAEREWVNAFMEGLGIDLDSHESKER